MTIESLEQTIASKEYELAAVRAECHRYEEQLRELDEEQVLLQRMLRAAGVRVDDAVYSLGNADWLWRFPSVQSVIAREADLADEIRSVFLIRHSLDGKMAGLAAEIARLDQLLKQAQDECRAGVRR